LDGGRTWGHRDLGTPEGSIHTLLFDPGRVGCCYALSEAGFFRSVDGGAVWDRTRVAFREEEEEEPSGEESSDLEGSVQGSPPMSLALDPASGWLYWGSPKGVLFSRDQGITWTDLPTVGLGTTAVYQLLTDPIDPDRLYAATPEGLFLYSASWRAWRAVREGIPAGEVHALALGPGNRSLWVGTAGGLFRIPVPERSESSVPLPVPGEAAQMPLSFPGTLTRDAGVAHQEPSIQEVQQAAIRYAEVMPEKVQGWRAGAVWRNIFPEFTLSLDQDQDSTVASSSSGGKTTFSVGPEDESTSLGFNFTWDLADLIWNPDQTSIDVRSRLMVQLRQDVLGEVTRLYFERKRLLIEFAGHSTEDPFLKAERSLRIGELTAQLDALTGGAFSKGMSTEETPS
jgi:hypothetical protein